MPRDAIGTPAGRMSPSLRPTARSHPRRALFLKTRPAAVTLFRFSPPGPQVCLPQGRLPARPTSRKRGGKAHRPAVVFPAAGHGRGVTAVLHGTVGLPSDCRFCLAAVCRFNLILWPRKLELNFLAAGVRLEPGVLFPFVFSAE